MRTVYHRVTRKTDIRIRRLRNQPEQCSPRYLPLHVGEEDTLGSDVSLK